MAYCEMADLESLLPTGELVELTSESGDLPDEAVVAEAIAQAGAVIDSYCGTRYVVPLSPVPDLVKALCIDLAIYQLYSRRDQMPEVRRRKYEAALKILTDLSKGLATLGEAEAASAQSADVAEISSATKIFSREQMSGW